MNIFSVKSLFILLTLFNTSHVFCQQANLVRFDRFVLVHYLLPESMKKDCNFNYAAMLVNWDERERVTKITFLNNPHPDLKKSFDYIKKFKFTPSMKLDGRPILIISCVDQMNGENCPVLYPYEKSPSKVMNETMEIIRKQLSRNPRTILSSVLVAGSPSPPIP